MQETRLIKEPPIYIIGAGSIVKDAHLPAYSIAHFHVAGITDLDIQKAHKLREKYNIPEVFNHLSEMVAAAPENAIFDLAVPATAIIPTLRQLPDHSAALIQKPLGENLEQADEILAVCRKKSLTAAVNLQLRFAPFVQMARDAINQGKIGRLTDVEVKVNVETPWEKWKFLEHARAAEIYYHSIHYVDLVRSFVGNPMSVHCKFASTHTSPNIDATRSSYILDYGSDLRVNIHTNHGHRFGTKHQESYLKFEGTKGAIKTQMGLLQNYPEGEPDWFEICTFEDGNIPEWKSEPINGSWFPHAFINSMKSLIASAQNPEILLPHSVEDVYQTMLVLDRAEQSSVAGGIPIDQH